MASQFEWVELYKEFAEKIIFYRNNRTELIEMIKQVYSKTGLSMPTLEKDNEIVDMDPFTVFGVFNKNSMKEENRRNLISVVKELFKLEAAVPSNFDGVPTLNNQNATYYQFIGSREENDIDDLWDLFESGLKYSNDASKANKDDLCSCFDIVMSKKGIGKSKITMGLFWINPDVYLNLDGRNMWFIYESGKVPRTVIDKLPVLESGMTSAQYFEIIDIIREYIQSGILEYSDFKGLSAEAWRYSNQVNEEARNRKNAFRREQIGDGLADSDVNTVHYWIYSPGDGASKWDAFSTQGVIGLGWSGIGDYSKYKSKDEMRAAMKALIDPKKSFRNGALATWQFLTEMKPGDVVFAKKGMRHIIGRGVVESDYYYDEDAPEYPNLRKINWTNIGEWEHPGQAVMKTLTDITAFTEYVDKLNKLVDGDDNEEDIEDDVVYPEYTADDFLKEVYMDNDHYETLVELIRMKRNVILQGAPGVGKTFAAKRLAYSMMGCKDQSRVMMVQFHQSYTYEDFIEGFRPSSTDSSFELKKGAFTNFCQKASEDPENEYFFIIDEINRGNLSKIFGELFMLIENDKRGNALQLLYSGDKFSVPPKLYIIGMMNTADRSLAMLDYALRRRFAFFEMTPGFSSEGFAEYQGRLDDAKFNSLITCVGELNKAIADDYSLGEGFCIGHSYFCNISEITEKSLSNIVEYEILPLIREYWYDEKTKVDSWAERLRSSIR